MKTKTVSKQAQRKIVVRKSPAPAPINKGEPQRTGAIDIAAKREAAKAASAPVVKAANKVATTKAAKHAGLWFFQMTPGGKMLRAYFIALILAQMPKGKLAVGVPFKLWPNVTLRGHLESGKITYQGAGSFILNPPGYNYFTDPLQAPQEDYLKAMQSAVKSGKAPSIYNFEMSPIK